MTSPVISLTRRPGRTIAMALALLCGTAVGVTAFETPAYAQKKPKASKDFAKVYGPVSELAGGDAAGVEAAKQKVPELMGAIQNGTDKNAAGGLIYNLGVKANDSALQLQGVNLMLDSGMLEPEKVGRFNWVAYQLNRQAGNWDGARGAIDGIIASGYAPQATLADGTSKAFGEEELRLLAAESYLESDDFSGATSYLKNLVSTSVTAGQVPPKPWISRGLSIAYNNELPNETVDFSTMLIKHYPTVSSWRDAINIQRNLFLYEDAEELDLLRLASEKGTLESERDYIDLIDAANVLRRPTEVKQIIDAGIASGALSSSNAFVAETKASANQRAAGDAADLASLERDAKKGGASAKIAVTSGDSYLSHRNGAKAEEMYNIALQRPGVDEGTVYTHLGMAQVMQGKKAEAITSFGKVQGKRKPIAQLWTVYAEE